MRFRDKYILEATLNLHSSITDTTIAKGMKEFHIIVCSSFSPTFFYMIYTAFNQIVFLVVQRFRAFFDEVLI